MPPSFELIIRGASRASDPLAVLGEAVSVSASRSGVITVKTLAATSFAQHEEADTTVVFAALEHAKEGKNVLLSCRDNDTAFAAVAGLATAIEADGGESGTTATASKKIHLDTHSGHMNDSVWWLKPDGKRFRECRSVLTRLVAVF